ncbi:MAG: hypothetical protein NC124_18195 [Clostridium sp.]|nr:hypothetical protein [Ruminococcus flavefaciens]MCM1500397.1 hypothetical protein [Clostridium sp.]
MKRKYIICGIAGIIILGALLVCGINLRQAAGHENQSGDMLANRSDVEAESLSMLSIQEGLDIVFAYAVDDEQQIVDIKLRGTAENGGRLRYVWHEKIHPEHDRVISEQGYLITSDNTVYRSYLYAIDLYDSTGDYFTRTERVNYYWVNMQTGEVIEQRRYNDSICQWELTEEYCAYVKEKEPWVSDDEIQESALTVQEALELLYDYLERGRQSTDDITLPRGQESWREWCEKDKPYYVFELENAGCIRMTDEKTYAIFKLAVQRYSQDYTGDVEESESCKYYEGEQNLQFYAIDMNTGEIIERREYAEERQREYTQEYEERIVQKFVEE